VCVCVSGSPPPAVAFLEATNQVIAAAEAASQNHSAITAGNIISLRAALFVTRTRAFSLGSNESAAAAPTTLNSHPPHPRPVFSGADRVPCLPRQRSQLLADSEPPQTCDDNSNAEEFKERHFAHICRVPLTLLLPTPFTSHEMVSPTEILFLVYILVWTHLHGVDVSLEVWTIGKDSLRNS
jgi:hypothetical protein